MCHCTSIYLGLILTLSLAPVAVAKKCYYCDVQVAYHCVGTVMTCGEEEDCFVGRGTAQGLPGIIIKGCMQTISCSCPKSIAYLDATYNLTTYCCPGDLCNIIQPRRATKQLDVTTAFAVAAGLILALLLCWLL